MLIVRSTRDQRSKIIQIAVIFSLARSKRSIRLSIGSKINDFVKYSLFCLMSPLLEPCNSTELVNLFEKQVMVSRYQWQVDEKTVIYYRILSFVSFTKQVEISDYQIWRKVVTKFEITRSLPSILCLDQLIDTWYSKTRLNYILTSKPTSILTRKEFYNCSLSSHKIHIFVFQLWQFRNFRII